MGKQKRMGFTIPDQPLGLASDKSDGNVREAMLGWPGGMGVDKCKLSKHGDTHTLPGEGGPPRDNMFDIMSHRFLAENQAGEINSIKEATIPKKFPKVPRKNATYVLRNTAIADKQFKLEAGQMWTMPKFKKSAQARISTFQEKVSSDVQE